MLQADGDLLLGLPYAVRRKLLAELGLDTGPVRTVEATTSRERGPRALWCLELAKVHTALPMAGQPP